MTTPINDVLAKMKADSKYNGNDNYGRPRHDYLSKLVAMDNDKLESETGQMIYHSARCSNNPRADWHWMVDACYDVCQSRDPKMYTRVYNKVYYETTGQRP